MNAVEFWSWCPSLGSCSADDSKLNSRLASRTSHAPHPVRYLRPSLRAAVARCVLLVANEPKQRRKGEDVKTRKGSHVKLETIAAAVALSVLLLAAPGPAEANSKLHFLKSKKFWYAAVAVAVPAGISAGLATRSNNSTFQTAGSTPASTQAQTQPARAH
jgi:hypothetical protein